MPRRTDEDRASVAVLRKAGYTKGRIRQEKGFSRIFINRWWNEVDYFPDKPRSGRPPKLTPEQKAEVIKSVKGKRHRSTRKVANELKEQKGIEVSRYTIRRVLRSEKLGPRHRQKKFKLTADSKQKRLEFAHDNLYRNFTNCVWLDESHIKPNQTGNRKNNIVWTDDPSELPVMEVTTQGKAFQVVGAMSREGVFPLATYEGNMNAQKYIAVLRDDILPEARRRFRKRPFCLIQDHCSSHDAKKHKPS
jgi:transposase